MQGVLSTGVYKLLPGTGSPLEYFKLYCISLNSAKREQNASPWCCDPPVMGTGHSTVQSNYCFLI